MPREQLVIATIDGSLASNTRVRSSSVAVAVPAVRPPPVEIDVVVGSVETLVAVVGVATIAGCTTGT